MPIPTSPAEWAAWRPEITAAELAARYEDKAPVTASVVYAIIYCGRQAARAADALEKAVTLLEPLSKPRIVTGGPMPTAAELANHPDRLTYDPDLDDHQRRPEDWGAAAVACDSVATSGGETVRCELDAGHRGPHQGGLASGGIRRWPDSPSEPPPPSPTA